ncbi:MAG TPA: threonine--tRNA ligase, partial [Acidobacteriota bacterium]
FWVGPPVEHGFYYDMDLGDRKMSEEDLVALEKKMGELSKQNNTYIRKEIPKAEAVEYFEKKGDEYKLDLLQGLEDGQITFYTQGNFTDLCRGPHIPNTGFIKAIKLTNIAGAYWKGDEKNKQLTRVYGITFPQQKELDEYLKMVEEAKKRDHRKLGKELELFHTSDEIGPGLIMWLPKGARVRRQIEDYLYDELFKRGYEVTYTPHVARLSYWGTSGHLGFYRENMFAPMELEDDKYQIKPMNCPIHIAVYRSALRSYRDLPIRLAEFGTVYRYERSGVMHGLMRVRGFTVDDAHLFCTLDQLENEIKGCLDFTFSLWRTFGFKDIQVVLATRPEKAVGPVEIWDTAIDIARKTLEKNDIEYEVEEGGGAFYGPKIDFKIRDAIGRWWQCSTTQVDFMLPERFQLEYIGPDGKPHQPIMLHRAITGSLERFFGVLIEHYAGAFPLWLAPVQVAILPIAERHHEYAARVEKELFDQKFRVFLDDRKEKIGAKIRDAQLQKVPYMIILGDKEVENNTVSVRHRTRGDLGARSIQEFVDELHPLIASRAVETN